SGWWNLYRERAGTVEPLWPMAAEFGEPQWAFGETTYGFDDSGRLVCCYVEGGVSKLAIRDPGAAGWRAIETGFSSIRELKVGSDWLAFFGASPSSPEALIRLDLDSGRAEV